jgi:hypothetical protein
MPQSLVLAAIFSVSVPPEPLPRREASSRNKFLQSLLLNLEPKMRGRELSVNDGVRADGHLRGALGDVLADGWLICKLYPLFFVGKSLPSFVYVEPCFSLFET